MKKLLRFLMLAVLLLPFALNAQTDVTIGDLSSATDNSYLPMNSLYEYSYSQQIYTSTEVGMGGTITSITVWMRGASDLYTMPFNIYMLEVNDDAFAASGSWIPVTSSDIVYSGSVTVHNTVDSAFTFELDLPFNYSGAGNLLICFDNNTGLWKGGLNGKVFTAADDINRSNYVCRDLTAYDPTNMSGIYSTISAARNVITLSILPSGGQICEKPNALVVSDVTAHGATLTWTSTIGDYMLEYKTADDSVWTEIPLSDTTYTLVGLTQNTAYNTRVKAICGVDFESAYKLANFTTLISCPAPTELSYTLTPGDGTVATVSWNENGTAEAWQICLNGDEDNLIDVTSNTYTFSGLTPETPYTVKVRAYCDAVDQSSWSSSITFTPTDAYQLTVNNGTTTNNFVPVYGMWVDDYIQSQFIIPAADLVPMQFGIINTLTFYASNATVNWGAAQFNVYLAETSETTLSAVSNYDNMTQVYAGSLSISGNKMVVNLITPYLYMGGNLMIGFLQTVSGTWGSCSWYGVNATDASMGGYGTSISQRDFLPKTTFDYTPGEEPDCLPVSGLAASGITADGATLSWTGTADSYTIINMSDSSVVTTTTDLTYDFTTLDPMTQYTFGVIANCGTSTSLLVTTSFTTACSSVTLPYTETFEETSATRDCWSLVATGNIGGNYGMGFVSISDRHALRFSSYSYANDYNQYGFSPLMNVSSDATNIKVTVVYATYNADNILNFGYVTETDTVWDPVDYTTVGDGDWQTVEFVFPVAATQVAVHYYGDYSYYAWIDTVMVAEMTGDYCFPVTNLVADSATSTSIFLSWNDDNNSGATYTIYNMADSSIVVSGLSDTEYEVSNLDAMTGYTFGVVANCSSIDVSNIMTVAAATACGNETCTITISGQDSYGDGWNGNTISVIQAGVVIGTFTIDDGADATETFVVCSGAPVSFSWHTGSYPGEASFEIFDGAGVSVYTGSGSSMTTGALFFTMNDACPSCLPASALTVDAATETSITISWTGTAASYNLYNGETFVANVADNSYTFAGLTPGLVYTLGVQAVCSVDDSSAIITINAQTECSISVINLPFSENFATNSPTRNCWTNIDADNDGYAWTYFEDYTGVDIESAVSYSYLNATYSAVTPDNWFISPKLHAPASSNITMEWTVQSAPSYPAEHYGVYVSTTTTDTSAFTMVNEWTITNGAQEQKVLDLSAYAGQDIYVAFRHHNCTDQYLLLIDNVEIYEGAYVPDTLTVTFAVNDATMGATIPAPGVYQYITGDTIFFGSQANPGYIFQSWNIIRGSVDTLSFGPQYANGYYVLANSWMQYGNITFIANFEAGLPDSTTITYAVNDATMGTTIPAPGTYTIYVGDNMIAEAVPNDGYMLSAWRVDLYESGVHIDSLTITNDMVYFSNPINFGSVSQEYADYDVTVNVTAIFEPGSAPVADSLTINLTINNPALGTITPAPGTYTLAVGDTITLEAFPNANVDFVGWQLSIAGQTAGTVPTSPFTLPITASAAQFGEIDIVAIFDDGTMAPDSLTVILSTADATMGTTNPAPGIHKYAVGDMSVITALPNPGYNFLYWIETATLAGQTLSDTGYAQTISLLVPQMYAGLTLSITAYFEPASVQPCETPTGLAVSSYDAESISLIWDNDDAVENWNVHYRVQGTDTWTTEAAYENNYTIHGLAAQTTYEIQLQANCGGDNMSDWTASIVQTTTGINSYLESNVTLFPNPAKEYIDVRIDGDVNVTAMEVYDVYGKLVNTVNVIDNLTRINVSALANGMYFVRVTTEQGVVTKRFIRN